MLRRLFASLLTTLVALLATPILWLRRKTRPGLRARWGRPGLDPSAWPKGLRVWVHAASAGDVKNLWPVAGRILTERPDAALVLSVVTNSGLEMAGKVQPRPHGVTLLPLDTPLAVNGTLDALQPDVLLLECTELWPTLVDRAVRRGVTVALCNGRLDSRKLPSYRRLFSLLGNPVRPLSLVCAQTPEDAERFVALGADPARVHVTGNCKFDAAATVPPVERVDKLRAELGGPSRWLVAGSTHVGEEAVVLSAFQAARAVDSTIKLLWAPRYNEQVDNVLGAAAKQGWKTCRKTAGPAACAAADVVGLDTMGELAASYGLATLALVGGSFVNRGGQNILEPAAQGVPVLHGPDMALAPDQVAALDGHGAERVTAETLPGVVQALLRDGAERERRGAEGRQRVQGLAGAGERHLAPLRPLLQPRRR